MKYIKTFENLTPQEKLLNSVTSYFEEMQPVSEEDGFVNCEYTEFFSESVVSIYFYFNINNTSEDSFQKFYNFLEKNKLKIYKESLKDNDLYEIIIDISEYKIKKYAELYNQIKRYNV
jgi:hypothetical protein